MGGRRRDTAVAEPGAGSAGAVTGLADLLGGESDRSRRFLGGLVAGAMVGAALAGMALVRRVPRGRDPVERR